MIRILAICDNPLITTGFANVARPMLSNFVKLGAQVICLGIMGGPSDEQGQLNFPLTPATNFGRPSMGFDFVDRMIIGTRPDVIWILADPGNVAQFLYQKDCVLDTLKNIEEGRYAHISDLKPFKIVCYTPIEGPIVDRSHIEAFEEIQNRGGAVVFYTDRSYESVRDKSPDMPRRVVHHGIDHVPWRENDRETKDFLRATVGLDGKFVVGAVGANKLVKNWGQLLKAIKHVDRSDSAGRILFYLHTDPLFVMDGAPLLSLAKHLKVDHRVIFKPDPNIANSDHPWIGSPYENNLVEWLKASSPLPDGFLDSCEFVNGVNATVLGELSFIDRMNLVDLFVDQSSVEGWGFPPWEAMAMGIPVLGIEDHWVRDEMIGGLRHVVPAIDPDLWDVYKTGSDMPKFHPAEMAQAILALSENPDLLRVHSVTAKNRANQLKWADSARKMLDIIEEIAK